ncbi:MAG: 3-hydroxyacyl-ACP dehydratase FabZ [Deltaproteobacteria bacterium]|nr:3-hydroxyacyl-ACP dehydratase FabZ [Deltaproteobacteria bacterium]
MSDTGTPPPPAAPSAIPPGIKVELDIHGILKCLPHRAPFVMVDKVTGVRDMKLYGYKNITANEPYFMGHFPEFPVFPGVLQIEAVGQLGCIFALQAAGVKLGDNSSQVFMLGVDAVRFRRMVIPGDKLDLCAWLIKRRGPVWKMGGLASVNGETACECEVLAWVGKKDQTPKMG